MRRPSDAANTVSPQDQGTEPSAYSIPLGSGCAGGARYPPPTMDMKDMLDFVQQQIADNPERQKPPMDQVLSFTNRLGGGISGSSEGGFGMRLDDRDEPPHLWAVTRRRVALSFEPWVVEILEVDDDEQPGQGTSAARVVAEHVLQPRVEAYALEGTIGAEHYVAYANITPQRYGREPLRQMANQLVLTACAPRRERFDAWMHAGCGLAMDMRPAARRVWAWRMPGELDAPQEVRLVLIDGDGVPDQTMVDAAPVLAAARIAPAGSEGDASLELLAVHEGVSYRLNVAWKDSARRARELLETDPDL